MSISLQNLPKSAVHRELSGSDREHRVFQPHVGESLAPTGTRKTIIRIEPKNEDGWVYHGAETYLAFTATTAGTNEALVSDGAWGMWSNYRVKLNGNVVESRSEVGIQQVRWTRNIASATWRDSIAKISRAVDSTEANNQNLGSVRLAIPMPVGSILAQTFSNKNMRFEVEFELYDSVNRFMTSDSADATLAVASIELHVSYIKNPLWAAANKVVNYIDSDFHQSTIADAATSANIQIPINVDNLRSITMAMLDTDTYADSATYTKQTGSLFNGSTKYSYKIAGVRYPPNQVTCTSGVEPLFHQLRVYRDDLDAVSNPYEGCLFTGSYDNNTLTDGFELCYDFRSDPLFKSGKSLIDGSAGNTAVLEWTGVANQPTTCFIFVYYNKTLSLGA